MHQLKILPLVCRAQAGFFISEVNAQFFYLYPLSVEELENIYRRTRLEELIRRNHVVLGISAGRRAPRKKADEAFLQMFPCIEDMDLLGLL